MFSAVSHRFRLSTSTVSQRTISPVSPAKVMRARVCGCGCVIVCSHKQVLNNVFLIFSGDSCVQSNNSDSDWLLKNFGQFRIIANFTDFINLKEDFNGVSRVTTVWCCYNSLTHSNAQCLLHFQINTLLPKHYS